MFDRINRSDISGVAFPLAKPKEKRMIWEVYTFLFELESSIKKDEIEIDWEHIEYKWIKPEEIKTLNTVPKLKETLDSVLEHVH